FLSFSEFAIHRYGTRQISCVISVLSTKIHKYYISIIANLIVFIVVQYTSVFSGSNNWVISMTSSTVTNEFMDDFSFNFKFSNTWFCKFQYTSKCLISNTYGL